MSLHPACPACGAANLAGSSACAVCAGPLAAERRPVVEERKVVTVLFADIGRSLAMIRGRDPEAAHALLAPAVTVMVQAVRRHGGTVAQMLGDGLLALFGAPQAQEDHAEAACLAALAIRDGIAAQATHDRPLRVRIGLHSGEVLITTPPPDSGVLLQPTGEVVHVAARLEQTAAPGTAQASLATLRLAGPRIQARALPARRLRGLTAPLATVELLAASEPQLPASAAGTRLVGRAAELARLAAALQGIGDAVRLVALEGEPGSGKSRLAAELARLAREQGIAVVAMLCQPHAEAPLAPLRRLLRELGPADTPAADPLALAVLRDAAAADDAWRREEPALRRARMLAAAAARIAAAAGGGPLLVVIEDLHWLEAESAAALALLLRQPPPRGLMLLATVREGGWPGPLPRDAWETIPLAPLQPADATALVTELLGEIIRQVEPRMAERLVAQMVARAGGNPFFAEQLAAAWKEAGPGGSGPMLPDRLRGVLAARLDRLPPSEKALVEIAAVLAAEASVSLLAAASASSEPACRAMLDRLVAAGLLREAAPDRLDLSHALLRDAAESALTRGRRRALHAACLSALEAGQGDAPVAEPARLLRHAAGAERPADIVRHAREAGRQAMAAYANPAAIAHYETALAALDQLPADVATRRTRLELLLALRDPLFRLGSIARIRAVLSDAAMLAAQLDDQPGIGQVAILASHAHWLAGDPVAARTEADRAASIAAAGADAQLALRARFQVALTQLATGALAEAAETMGEVATALTDGSVAHGRFGLDHSLAATAAGYRARALAELGMTEAAVASAQASEAAADRDGRPFAQIFASLAVAVVAMSGARWPDALARFEAAVDWCTAADSRLMRPVALSLLGQARLGAGETAAALSALRDAVAEADAMGFRIHQAQRLALLGEAELASGAVSAAAACAARARSLARRCGERVGAAMAQRLAALAAMRTGDAAAARRGLASAGRAAQALGLRALAARCAADAAGLDGPFPASAMFETARRAAG